MNSKIALFTVLAMFCVLAVFFSARQDNNIHDAILQSTKMDLEAVNAKLASVPKTITLTGLLHQESQHIYQSHYVLVTPPGKTIDDKYEVVLAYPSPSNEWTKLHGHTIRGYEGRHVVKMTGYLGHYGNSKTIFVLHWEDTGIKPPKEDDE
jgi:hypothetical protein